MNEVLPALRALVAEIGITDFVDIAVMTIVIYVTLVWLKRTRRAVLAITGLLIVTGVYLLARQLDLRLTVAVLQGFFAVILVALVVIFQEELRYAFERIAQLGLGRGRRAKTPSGKIGDEALAALGRTLLDLARARIGAIVVLPVHDAVDGHLDGGEALDGRVSEALLKSLFDPHSIGHDGAVVVAHGKVTRFGCHLPLSRDVAALAGRGTRHAAALGLAERTDAYCFVVSEERGSVGLARHGRLQPLDDAEALHRTLTEYVGETGPAGSRPKATPGFLRRNNREKLVAVTIALALWFVLVHEARVGYRTLRVPVEFSQLPEGLAVGAVRPEAVEVTFSAPRRSLYFVGAADVRMNLRAWALEPGPATLLVGPSDFAFPEGLTFETAKPRQVDVVVDATRGPDAPNGR